VTTQAWSFPIIHSNDANFRAWASDFAAKLAVVGLVQTADTGQINLATATRPAINTAAGYQVWRFSDNSIFLKFEYGTGSGSTDAANIWFTVGTNSNGSGTLTGTVSNRRVIAYNQAPLSPGTSRLSYMSHSAVDGFFGFVGYINGGAVNSAYMGCMAARSVGASGLPDTQGATVYFKEDTVASAAFPYVQALNFLTGVAQPIIQNGSHGYVPHSITNTVVGSDQQAFVNWTAFPRAYPVMQIATVSATEFPTGTGFTTTLVGPTPKSYITIDEGMRGTQATSAAFRLAMLWE
jgi:hypothetical protein